MLDDLGLVPALEWLVQNMGQRSGIECKFEIDDPSLALPSAHSTAVFRIVQECVNNVLKHSEAKEATVSAFRDGSALRIVVVDDGRGLGAASAGFGMSSIAERVKLLGGQHDVDSESGGGTIHRISIPLGEGARG